MSNPDAVNPVELGSKEVQKRVADVGRKIEIPVIDNVTGKKVCHKFYAPVVVQMPIPNKLNPKIVDLQIETKISNIMCLGANCHLWNDKAKECREVTQMKATEKIAELLEQIDGHNRLHTTEG